MGREKIDLDLLVELYDSAKQEKLGNILPRSKTKRGWSLFLFSTASSRGYKKTQMLIDEKLLTPNGFNDTYIVDRMAIRTKLHKIGKYKKILKIIDEDPHRLIIKMPGAD